MKTIIPRLMLAAPASGSGKTTIFCALLGALQKRQYKSVAFKSGPDYIDPMFHRTVLETPSHNLDMFLLGGGDVGALRTKQFVCQYSQGADIALIEGAMGYYDGIGTTSENSAYSIAKCTKTPVILVLNGKGAALSLAAMIHGFQTYREDNYIAGFILNQVKKGVYAYFKEAIEEAVGIPGCGYLPPLPEGTLQSRHLGLVTAAEVGHIQEKMRLLAETAEETLDIDRLIQLAHMARTLTVPDWELPKGQAVTIAVAKDEAFCFYYEAALDVLRQMGAKLVFFSPLRDTALPPCDGLYFGGGYPELHAQTLAANETMKRAIHEAMAKGTPCIAECGGFMYLLEAYEDQGKRYPFVGAITGTSHMTPSLTRFGYVQVKAQDDTAFCPKGYTFPAHEFHYSDSNHNGTACIAIKAKGKRHWPCFHSVGNLWAGYPHMHFAGCLEFAQQFLRRCREYAVKEKE